MVWGFGGGGSKVPDQPPEVNIPTLNNEKESKSIETKYRFDSAALERAAKAAKDLENSPHAKQLLELQKTAEVTKQLELQKHNNEFSMDLERLRQEEQRKTDRSRLEQQAKINQQKAQYEDQLTRRRYEDQINQQRSAEEDKLRREKLHQEELLARQKESLAQQEEIKRRTIDYEVQKKSEAKAKEIEATYNARAVYERKNSDIHLKSELQNAEEKRKTVLQAIETASTRIGEGFRDFITDWDKVKSTALGLTLFAGGIYGAKYSVSITARAIESRIGRPKLLKETSRLNIIDLFSHPIKSFERLRASRRPQDALKNVIFRPNIEEELRDVAIATRNTKMNKSFYRNFMFYGPPGTGKTLFAKRLAQHSGMDFAMFSGGDVGPMGRSAVSHIHKIFDWSQTSRRGLLLFIDEAEAFLSERRSGKVSEELHQVVDAFLNRTGEQSNKYMFVLSTNLPEQIDKAVEDRIDEEIEFEIPSLEERKRLVRLYFDKYVLEPASTGKRRGMKVEQFDYGIVCDKIAGMIEGFSGRAISKLAVAWQADAFASADRLLTEEMIMKRVNKSIPRYMKRLERMNPKLYNQ